MPITIIHAIIAVIALILSGLTITIALFIYKIQRRQTDKIEKIIGDTFDIGKDTKSITEKLATESSIRNTANKIFQLDINEDTNQRQYKVVYPVSYIDKPLPLIYQGDFYAIHIISIAIGMERINLTEIETGNMKFNRALTKGDIIFICSPQSNPVLNSIYPYPKIITKEQEDLCNNNGIKLDNIKNIFKNERDLKNWFNRRKEKFPCWFVTEYQLEILSNNKHELYPVKKIQIFDNIDPTSNLGPSVESPAEQFYRNAVHKKLRKEHGTVRDYGIFARVTQDTNRRIIIAGIHQYGTWIVAHFLYNLIIGKVFLEEDKATVFNSNDDFIAIITGDFETDKLKVDHCGVDGNHLWIRRSAEEPWLRYDFQPKPVNKVM